MLNPLQLRAVSAYVSGLYMLIAIRAGWGSGKSRALGTIARVAGEQGVSVMWITDSQSRIDTVVQPVCEALLRPLGWRFETVRRRWVKGAASIWLRSYFRPGTKSSEANSVEGANVGLVLIDEAQVFPDDEVLRKVFGRARTGPVPPCIVVAGLPVYNAWWELAAQKMGPTGCIVHGTSFDNRANLRPEWFRNALATLGQREFDAMLCNLPRPPEGQIYDVWRPDDYPVGNVVRGWRWRPDMRTVWSVDFGTHMPSATLWARDPDLRAWVLFAECNPSSPSDKVHTLAAEMCRIAWPKMLAGDKPPSVPYLFDDAVCDPAGKVRKGAKDGDVADTDVSALGLPPGVLLADGLGGIGRRPDYLRGTDPGYVDLVSVRSGIIRTAAAIERQQILVTGEVWDAGSTAPAGQRSFARAILGYRRDRYGEPVKGEGHDDVMDTVRYLVRWPGSGLWFAHPFDTTRAPMAMVSSPWAPGWAAATAR